MIDISDEDVLTFKQAADWLPRRRAGRKVAASTLWRWASVGVAGIRLEVIFVGATRCTSKQSLQRFFERVSAARMGGSTPTGPAVGRTRTESQQRKDSERAGSMLDKMIANPPRRGRKAMAAGS